MADHYDIIIVGGGMVGASLAACLTAQFAAAPIRILIVESVALTDNPPAASYQPSFDARATALSYGSQQIYTGMGLWGRIEQHVTPIRDIHVSDRGRFGSVWMNSTAEGLPALGYVADNKWLGCVLLDVLHAHSMVEFACPATVVAVRARVDGVQLSITRDNEAFELSTKLLVVADGAQSGLRARLGISAQQVDYCHAALVCNVQTQQAHNQVAYERFTRHGPLALLPLGETAASTLHSLVWTRSHPDAERLVAVSEAEFNAELQREFGFRLGRVERCGQRFCYPLSLIEAQEQIRPHVIVMGNAAHSLHPVAGQGFNLALRAVQKLVTRLRFAQLRGEPLGDPKTLHEYFAEQRVDQRNTVAFSHLAATAFVNNNPVTEIGRDLGLLGLDLLPALKSRLVRQAAGLGVVAR